MRPVQRAGLAVLATAALIGAVGCTTAPTPYQPYVEEGSRGIHGGYSEQRLAADRYIVRFHGNEFTSRDRVEGYLLYRAAQLTLENGFDSFVMVDRRVEHDVETYVSPDPFYRPWYGPNYGYWHPDWQYYSPGYGWNYWHPGMGVFWRDAPNYHAVEAFEASAEILLRKGSSQTGDARSFNAREIVANLGPSIQLPQR